MNMQLADLSAQVISNDHNANNQLEQLRKHNVDVDNQLEELRERMDFVDFLTCLVL